MPARTFAIGDIHGDLEHLEALLGILPRLSADDTLVFLGDYIDRGPDSAGVVRYVRELRHQTPAQVVTLRGNHEDGWLRTIREDWPQFVLPAGNGCLAAMESFLGREVSPHGSYPEAEDFEQFVRGTFFPPDVLDWMDDLPWWYEDEHAIYVHAGLPNDGQGGFLHPSRAEGKDRTALLWLRGRRFFEGYRGKLVVFGHTVTSQLPPELSTYTPEDPDDLWAGPAVIGLDTGCGKGGFLTALELPEMIVYESRHADR